MWWHGRGKLPLALTVRWAASWRRVIFDLHRVAGIYPLLLLVVVAVTGVAFSFYDYVRYGHTEVWLDQYSGGVLRVTDSRAAPLGVRVLDHWTLPVHTGEIAGLAGRILVCVAGLAPLVLFATGLLMWRNRRKAARRVRERRLRLERPLPSVRSRESIRNSPDGARRTCS